MGQRNEFVISKLCYIRVVKTINWKKWRLCCGRNFDILDSVITRCYCCLIPETKWPYYQCNFVRGLWSIFQRYNNSKSGVLNSSKVCKFEKVWSLWVSFLIFVNSTIICKLSLIYSLFTYSLSFAGPREHNGWSHHPDHANRASRQPNTAGSRWEWPRSHQWSRSCACCQWITS